jgi:hypothetical protein
MLHEFSFDIQTNNWREAPYLRRSSASNLFRLEHRMRKFPHHQKLPTSKQERKREERGGETSTKVWLVGLFLSLS